MESDVTQQAKTRNLVKTDSMKSTHLLKLRTTWQRPASTSKRGWSPENPNLGWEELIIDYSRTHNGAFSRQSRLAEHTNHTGRRVVSQKGALPTNSELILTTTSKLLCLPSNYQRSCFFTRFCHPTEGAIDELTAPWPKTTICVSRHPVLPKVLC